MNKDSRVFKASQIDSNRKGYIADMSEGNSVNPDCYWAFDTKKKAVEFVRLVDGGMSAHEASRKVNK